MHTFTGAAHLYQSEADEGDNIIVVFRQAQNGITVTQQHYFSVLTSNSLSSSCALRSQS